MGVARMLLEAGADVETPDNYGQTPFFMACWKGHAEVASLLLEYGANKDCRTKTGITYKYIRFDNNWWRKGVFYPSSIG